MKRSLNTLIESTDVREFKVVEIQIQKISESKRTTYSKHAYHY